MSNIKQGTTGVLVAIFVLFLGMLIHSQLQAPDGKLGEALLIYTAIAVPGGLLAAWIAGTGRRSR